MAFSYFVWCLFLMALVAASADWAPSNKDLPKDLDNYAGKKKAACAKSPRQKYCGKWEDLCVATTVGGFCTLVLSSF